MPIRQPSFEELFSGQAAILAPMEDVSDPPFRVICKRYGADVLYTEFISSSGLLYDARYVGAGWMLQALLIGAWFRVLNVPNHAALLALGKTGWIAASNAIWFAALLVLLPGGFMLGGMLGAIAGLAVADAVKYVEGRCEKLRNP